jgi:hypothetical protein
MTPDELPADMEAAVEADILYAGKGPLAVTRTTTLRALLKAYQEQRRALDAINQLARDRLALIPADLVCGGVVGDLLVDILGRTILNQKGDER